MKMTPKGKVAAITQQFKQAVESKYNVIEMKLFGSFARGDYSKTSELLNMSPTQRREYRMLPRYFCKHLGQAFLAWSRAHPAVALPRMAVALQ
ncbi:MAG TPA: nucleotidyltransferase domain-containing protein [Sedimentisphaerales bacterium]|nr:nucleotidyltransferase domain-containing protein [Sedimentisphaerales bacterium]